MSVSPANPESTPSGRLLIVDGHAYAYRAFYAIRSLSSPSGRPTNAIYGFIKMLGKMRATLEPTHVTVIWDGGLAAERMELLPEYKAQRPPMPDDLETQIEEIKEYLEAARVASCQHEGIEADDWIAAFARRAEQVALNVVIASSDKDFMQLVSARIGLLNPNDKSDIVWAAEQVRAKTGVPPEAIVDWLALLGDAVDNIPGVPGVGPKTAAELLRQFGSVDALYRHLDEVKSERVRGNLQAAEAAVRRNQQLVRLREDLPVACELPACAVRPPDAQALLPLFTRWGFRSLARELEASAPQQAQLL